MIYVHPWQHSCAHYSLKETDYCHSAHRNNIWYFIPMHQYIECIVHCHKQKKKARNVNIHLVQQHCCRSRQCLTDSGFLGRQTLQCQYHNTPHLTMKSTQKAPWPSVVVVVVVFILQCHCFCFQMFYLHRKTIASSHAQISC